MTASKPPEIDALLKACGFKSDRQQARDAVLVAHHAVLRSMNARSRRAHIKNARLAMEQLELILRVLPESGERFTYPETGVSDAQLLEMFVAGCNAENELNDADLSPQNVRAGVAAAMRKALGL